MRKDKIIVFITAFFMFYELLSIRAYAYIDVSATTYVIQIVAGIIVAAGAAAGVIISKVKKKAKEKFNIDLEKKEKEYYL